MKNFNIPLSARGCSPLSPKGKARGLKDKERPLQFAEADSSPTRSQEGGLMIRLLFCGNDGQRFLRSDSCRTRKSTYAAARALPFSESLRKLSITSVSASGKVASTRLCRCGGSVSLNISSTETLKKNAKGAIKRTLWLRCVLFLILRLPTGSAPWRWLIVVDLNFFLCVSRLTFQRISYLDFIK